MTTPGGTKSGLTTMSKAFNLTGNLGTGKHTLQTPNQRRNQIIQPLSMFPVKSQMPQVPTLNQQQQQMQLKSPQLLNSLGDQNLKLASELLRKNLLPKLTKNSSQEQLSKEAGLGSELTKRLLSGIGSLRKTIPLAKPAVTAVVEELDNEPLMAQMDSLRKSLPTAKTVLNTVGDVDESVPLLGYKSIAPRTIFTSSQVPQKLPGRLPDPSGWSPYYTKQSNRRSGGEGLKKEAIAPLIAGAARLAMGAIRPLASAVGRTVFGQGAKTVGSMAGQAAHHVVPGVKAAPGMLSRIANNPAAQSLWKNVGMGMTGDMAATYLTGEDSYGGTAAGLGGSLLEGALMSNKYTRGLGRGFGVARDKMWNSPYAQKAMHVSGAAGIAGGLQQMATGHDYITNPIGSSRAAMQENLLSTAQSLGFRDLNDAHEAARRMSVISRSFPVRAMSRVLTPIDNHSLSQQF